MKRESWVDASLSVLLAIQILTLFVATPLGAQYPFVLEICHITFAIISVFVLTQHRVVQGLLLMGVTILTLEHWANGMLLSRLGIDTSAWHGSFVIVISFVFNALITALVARRVLGSDRITQHHVQGAVLLYLNAAALFSIIYIFIEHYVPNAIISTTGAILPTDHALQVAALNYFSLATLTTTGYGDLTPVHTIARSVANIEAVFGQLFPATLLARVVALQLAHSDSNTKKGKHEKPI